METTLTPKLLKNKQYEEIKNSETFTTRAPHWTQIINNRPPLTKPNENEKTFYSNNLNNLIKTTILPTDIKTTIKTSTKSEEYVESEEEEDLFFWKPN